MTDYLDRLAHVAAEASVDTLPSTTVEAAKRVLLDTLGAIAAGSTLPENGRLARLAAARAPQGVATLLGHGAKADAGWAALVNATAGVALEVDEGNRLGGGHPAIHVIPGALAVAEEQAGGVCSRASSQGTRSARASAVRRRRARTSTPTARGGRSPRPSRSPGSPTPRRRRSAR